MRRRVNSSSSGERVGAKSSWRALRTRLRRDALGQRTSLVALLLICVVVLALRARMPQPRVARVFASNCRGKATLGAPSGAHVYSLTVGNCAFKFVPHMQCDASLASIGDMSGIQALPCANWDVALTRATRLSVLREFGIMRRHSERLPMHVYGALVPASYTPFDALHTPESRPYTWQAIAGDASSCQRGRCRALIRAMLLSYLVGCGPLHNDALWAASRAGEAYDAHEAVERVMLAFPRQCSPHPSNDIVAEDLLVRYLRAACEVPVRLWTTLPSLASHERVAPRAKFLLALLGRRGAWWSRGNLRGCKVAAYSDEDAWEDVDRWRHSLASASGTMQ